MKTERICEKRRKRGKEEINIFCKKKHTTHTKHIYKKEFM